MTFCITNDELCTQNDVNLQRPAAASARRTDTVKTSAAVASS